jgi:hypothetical protein
MAAEVAVHSPWSNTDVTRRWHSGGRTIIMGSRLSIRFDTNLPVALKIGGHVKMVLCGFFDDMAWRIDRPSRSEP